ncbi:hypothetical protein [Flammeovirga kamogawensis]|uniref:DUF3256 family protein n=1 Tax=Flammeovirga kamogawensis TaxID=373891 RepID=A0ABX8H4U6_9BACT|nr:hypothetical protein [Flammeovirga kamogawensis]MBB6463848.1 hypothetical protein [Flammeovirga kamogawensis]QWG10773.1 DUF3256 family protein [Flammeovirga kamogawensis]TRX63241.1 hypothetical protein EO216_26670 [Flammeovirga kamogawensis]
MNKFTLFLMLIISYTTSAQTLTEIFINIPSEISGNLTAEEQRTILQKLDDNSISFYKNSITNEISMMDDSDIDLEDYGIMGYYLNPFLPKNGYYKITQAIPLSQGVDFENVCYWNLDNGSKLVAKVSCFGSYCCGPIPENITFYNYKNLRFEKLETEDIFPSPTYEDIVDIEKMKQDGHDPEKYKDFILPKINNNYELPIQGKNITIAIEVYDYLEEESEMYYIVEPYIKGAITYLWKDGHFEIEK